MKISFEGLPGCRKKEIFQAIDQKFGYKFNSSHDFNWHRRFLANPQKYSLTYELNRLIQFYHQFDNKNQNKLDPENSSDKRNSSDRKNSSDSEKRNRLDSGKNKSDNTQHQLYDSLHSLKNVYVDYLVHQKWMNRSEYEVFMKFYRLLYVPPDIIIYFYGTFENTYRRMKNEVKESFSPPDSIDYLTDHQLLLNPINLDPIELLNREIILEDDLSLISDDDLQVEELTQEDLLINEKFSHSEEDLLSESYRYDYSKEEFKKLHYQFEWVFDNNNCRIPIFKVNIDDDLDVILNNLADILRKVENLVD